MKTYAKIQNSIRFKPHLKSCSHQQNSKFISAEKLSSLASEVKANAISDDCLIDSFKDAAAEVSCKLKVKILAKDLVPLIEAFMENHKSEMFYIFRFCKELQYLFP